MTVRLDWLGCATYRLTVDGLVLFLDAYMDRPASAPPVGLTTREVTRADFVLVGHSHFDHLWGAETIARNTGATVIGSYETVRVLHDEEEIDERQLMPVSGGECIRLADGVTVRVFPSLHSCTWTDDPAPAAGEVCLGDYGVLLQDQRARYAAGRGMQKINRGTAYAGARLESNQHPRFEGGAFIYLIETPEGSILWQDSMGHWTGLWRDLRPDVALLAAVGRGNVDGQPIQGSVAQFVGREAELVRARRIHLNHHDDFMGRGAAFLVDDSPIREEVARRFPPAEIVTLDYSSGYPIFAGIGSGSARALR